MQETTLPESEANSSGSLLQISGDLLMPRAADTGQVQLPMLPMDNSCLPSADTTGRATTSNANALADLKVEVSYRGPEPNHALEGEAGTLAGAAKATGRNGRQELNEKEFTPTPPARVPQVTSGVVPKKVPRDPGLNPPSATRIGEQAREAAIINRRVALNTSETWAPGALEEVTRLIGELQARIEMQEKEKLWQTMELSQTFLIPKTVRMYDAEMTGHARRAENMR